MSLTIADHIDEHVQAIWKIDIPILREISQAIIDCFKRGGKLYVCGNGGSAADAQHIAAELVGRYKINRKPLPCIALTTDSSTLTAVGNDYAFEYIFARQIEGLLSPEDMLWVLTTSGRSLNILEAINAAKKVGSKIVAFTGSNRYLKEKCDFVFHAENSETDIVQECHIVAYHIICGLVETHFSV